MTVAIYGVKRRMARKIPASARDEGALLKVSKTQAAANRERILTEAGKMIRARGIAGSGVDALAGAAGLSYGSLYSQFGSKDRLAAEALAHALGASADRLNRTGSLAEYVNEYLSAAHKGRLSEGCPLAALAGEMPRESVGARAAFTSGVKAMADRVARLVTDRANAEEAGLAMAATLVGGLILARGVDDAALADRILAATRAHLLRPAEPGEGPVQRPMTDKRRSHPIARE